VRKAHLSRRIPPETGLSGLKSGKMPVSEKLLSIAHQLISFDKALAWDGHAPNAALFSYCAATRRGPPGATRECASRLASFLVLSFVNEQHT
jgi:hypothetical protein